MARVKIANLNRLGADARRQVLDALQSPPNPSDQPKQVVEDVSPSLSKMHNIKTKVDGITFDSLDEATRYGELKIEERAGLITKCLSHKSRGE